MPQDSDHSLLVARWFALTRDILPAMAERAGWPIHEDHCFMRVCLDNAFGRPWREAVAAPAHRSMSGDQLAAAVALAETVATDSSRLFALNDASLRCGGRTQGFLTPLASPSPRANLRTHGP